MNAGVSLAIGALAAAAIWLAVPGISLPRHILSSACLLGAIWLAAAEYVPS